FVWIVPSLTLIPAEKATAKMMSVENDVEQGSESDGQSTVKMEQMEEIDLYDSDFDGQSTVEMEHMEEIDVYQLQELEGGKKDCVIIGTDPNPSTKDFVDQIESQLSELGIRVEKMFLNSSAHLTITLENAALQNFTIAVYLGSYHVETRSMNIQNLKGDRSALTIQVKHGIQFIANACRKRNASEGASQAPLDELLKSTNKTTSFCHGKSRNGLTISNEDIVEKQKAVEKASNASGVGDSSDMQLLLTRFLAKYPLTIADYDKIIMYALGKRELSIKQKYNDNPDKIYELLGPPLPDGGTVNFAVNTKKSNMTEKLNRAYRSLDDNPYNLDAWNQLIRDACLSKIDEARPIFEKLIATFPTCGRYWKTYIEQEMKARNFDKVEKLFQRSLLKVLNIDLWKCYVNYVKDTKASTPNYKERMAQAYDFALDKMGMDMHAQSLWMDYITFLKGVEAVGSFAENQRIAAVRKVFQRAIVTPIIGVEVLWKEYVSFEQSINTLIAEKMTMERAKDHMNARRVAKELEALTRGLNRHSPSLPPSGTAEEAKQVDLWKKYLSWEKANPLGTEDKILLTRRVMFAYEQCLLVLSHHPDIWYEATLFLEQSAKIMNEKGDVTSSKLFSNEVANMFERCTGGILKNCSLLHFAYADFEESRLQYEKVHQIYQKLIDIRDVDPTL
ncbi:hypothetical protein QYM36_013884, partial [Artemia franciscana]